MSSEATSTDIRHAIRRANQDDAHVLSLVGDRLELTDTNRRTPLFHAVLAGRESLIQKLIAKGASPSHRDFERRSPLHFAVQERGIAAAKLLLEAGAPVDAKDKDGNTPLWGAVMQFRGFKEMIDLLIDFGASPDSRNIYDKSPRDLALSMKTGEVVSWLDRDTANRPKP